MVQLQVIVYASVTARDSGNRLMERIIEIPDSVSIPYECICKSLKFLYGSGSVISFNVL